MSSVIVQPLTANVMNAVMCGLMSLLVDDSSNLCKVVLTKALV